MEDEAAVAEADRLYAFIGKYVICFQWLEGQMDEIFLLFRGTDNWSETQHWLAGKTIKEKIDAFEGLLTDEKSFRPVSIVGWYDYGGNVIRRLHLERTRRNSLMHSQYLFDFLTLGAPILRTDIQRRGGKPHLDQEGLSSERCTEVLDEIALLSVDLGKVCWQLRAVWKGSPI